MFSQGWDAPLPGLFWGFNLPWKNTSDLLSTSPPASAGRSHCPYLQSLEGDAESTPRALRSILCSNHQLPRHAEASEGVNSTWKGRMGPEGSSKEGGSS